MICKLKKNNEIIQKKKNKPWNERKNLFKFNNHEFLKVTHSNSRIYHIKLFLIKMKR